MSVPPSAEPSSTPRQVNAEEFHWDYPLVLTTAEMSDRWSSDRRYPKSGVCCCIIAITEQTEQCSYPVQTRQLMHFSMTHQSHSSEWQGVCNENSLCDVAHSGMSERQHEGMQMCIADCPDLLLLIQLLVCSRHVVVVVLTSRNVVSMQKQLL